MDIQDTARSACCPLQIQFWNRCAGRHRSWLFPNTRWPVPLLARSVSVGQGSENWDTQLLFRTDVQISNQPLLPLEQIAVGGRYTVRGYRENLLVRDQAMIASLELRIPIVQNAAWAEYLQLVPFSDYGYAKNKDLPTFYPRSIYSVGRVSAGGFRMKCPAELKLDFEFYWGYALVDVNPPDHNLHDVNALSDRCHRILIRLRFFHSLSC